MKNAGASGGRLQHGGLWGKVPNTFAIPGSCFWTVVFHNQLGGGCKASVGILVEGFRSMREHLLISHLDMLEEQYTKPWSDTVTCNVGHVQFLKVCL